MEDYKPILVAVDFSEYSEAALVWAAETARRIGVPLIVLHVVHDPGAAPGYYAPNEAETGSERQEDRAAEMLDRFISEIAGRQPGLIDAERLRTRLVAGLPATRIIEVAEGEGVQLIVVGSQGRSALTNVLLGSKAARVAQLASMPVTIVKRPRTA